MHSLLLTPHTAFIEGVGGPELMMILFVVLLLFGGEKLPEFARGFGKAMREFRKAAGNVEDEFKRAIDDVERNAAIDLHLDKQRTPPRQIPMPPAVTPPTYDAAQRNDSFPPTHDDPNPSDKTSAQRADDTPGSTPN